MNDFVTPFSVLRQVLDIIIIILCDYLAQCLRRTMKPNNEMFRTMTTIEKAAETLPTYIITIDTLYQKFVILIIFSSNLPYSGYILSQTVHQHAPLQQNMKIKLLNCIQINQDLNCILPYKAKRVYLDKKLKIINILFFT